jgi:hypothetical protein
METNMAITQVVATDTSGTPYNSVPVNQDPSIVVSGSATKVSDGDLLSGVAISDAGVDVFGSTVLDNDVADKAISAGVFAHNNQRPIAKQVTMALADVDTDALQSPAADPAQRRSIHYIQNIRTSKIATAIRAGDWDEYNGEWLNPVATSNDVLANDDAAHPTREVPGELVFKSGAANPTQADYSKKTG